jgi:hypothetical protein
MSGLTPLIFCLAFLVFEDARANAPFEKLVRKKLVRKKSAHREIAHSQNDFVFVRKNVVRKKFAHSETAHKIFPELFGLNSSRH